MLNRRVFFVGWVGGFLAALAARDPLEIYGAGMLLPEGRVGDPAWVSGLSLLAGLLLIGTGAVAARMSGLRGRPAGAMAGAAAGLIAALVVEMVWGGAAAGALGMRTVLGEFLKLITTERNFFALLIEAAWVAHGWTYISAGIAIAAGLAFGALGGFLAGAGGPAEAAPAYFALTISPMCLLMVMLNLMLAMILVPLAGSMAEEAAREAGFRFSSPHAGMQWPLGVGLVQLVFWQGVLVWELWRARANAPDEQAFLFSTALLWGVIPLVLDGLLIVLGRSAFGILPLIGLLISVLLAGITLWEARRMRGKVFRIIFWPMPAEWVAWGVLIGGFLTIVSNYLITIGSFLNVMMLIGPFFSVLNPRGGRLVEKPLQSVIGPVLHANYQAHPTVLMISGGLIVLAGLIGYAVVKLTRRDRKA